MQSNTNYSLKDDHKTVSTKTAHYDVHEGIVYCRVVFLLTALVRHISLAILTKPVYSRRVRRHLLIDVVWLVRYF